MFTKNYGMLKLNIIFLPFSICFALLLTSHSAQRFYLFVVVFFGECFNYFYYDIIRTEILPYLGSQITCGSNFKSDKICIKLSDLDSPLKAYTPRSYLCCQQNVLVWFVSAFRRKKARDKNGKTGSVLYINFTSSQTDTQSKQTCYASIAARLHRAAAVNYSTRNISLL